MKKIACIGSAPSSVQLAPYHDPSWAIWSCSPGAYPHIRRGDVHWEVHRWEPGKAWFSPDYVAWMARHPRVLMLEHRPEIPNSEAFDPKPLIEAFGPYIWKSSLSWMIAAAILEQPDEIGIFGVDMSATDEYIGQRDACHFLIWEAKKRGIRVTLPPESDLLLPGPLYGVSEIDPMHVKLLCRREELNARIGALEQAMQSQHMELMFLKGALDDNTYMLRNWVNDKDALELVYWNPEPKLEPALEPEQTTIDVLKEMTGQPGGVYLPGELSYVASLDAHTPALPKKKGIIKKNGNGKDHSA